MHIDYVFHALKHTTFAINPMCILHRHLYLIVYICILRAKIQSFSHLSFLKIIVSENRLWINPFFYDMRTDAGHIF